MNDTNHEPKGCSETAQDFTLPTDQTLDYVHRSRLNDALAEIDAQETRHTNEIEALRSLLKMRERQREEFTATIDSLTALGQSLEEEVRALKAQPSGTFHAPPYKAGHKLFYADYEYGSVMRCTVLRPIMEWHADAPAPAVKYRVRFDSNGEVTTVDECDVFGLIDEAVAALKGGE